MINAQITISTDNAAFEDSPADEIERIFAGLDYSEMTAALFDPENGFYYKRLFDLNGNRVGEIKIESTN